MFTIFGFLVMLAGLVLIPAWGVRWILIGLQARPTGVRPRGLLLGVLLMIGGLLMTQSLGQVEAGTRGVVLQFGAVTGKIFPEGLYFKVPFVQSVERMSVQIHKYESPASAASKDLQNVQTDVTLNYSLNPSLVAEVYRNLRREYIERIVKPAVQESVKAITAQFDAEELITRRADVRARIEETVRGRIEIFGLSVEALAITNFQFSETFASSIEAKVVAVQRAQEAENTLLRIEVEAKQREAQAVGEKEANIRQAEGIRAAAILTAEGEAQAILTVAEAQADANAQIDATLTEQLIRYALVRELSDDIRVLILPTGQEFILGPEVLMGGRVDE